MKPREVKNLFTGVILSSLSMFMLALPVLFYGTADYTQEQLLQKKVSVKK